MGHGQSNNATVTQAFYNNIVQSNQQECSATVSTAQSGNYISVSGTTINGNFTGISNQVSTDASCLIVSSMQDSISNILSSTLNQTNTSVGSLYTSKATNKYNVNQSVSNNISQINTALCSANTVVSQEGNFIYLSDSTVNGNFIGLTNTSTSAATCSMQNTQKNVTYNQAQSSATQGNTDIGVLGLYLAIIALVVGLVIIIVLISFAKGALSHVGASPSPVVVGNPQQTAQNQQLINLLIANESTGGPTVGPNPGLINPGIISSVA